MLGVWVFRSVHNTNSENSRTLDLLSQELIKIASRPDVKARFAALGFEPVGSAPDEFAAQIRAEIPKWGKIIKDAGIKAE